MYTKPMYLNRKVIEDFPVHPEATKNPDLFGVEVELEGKKIKTNKPELMGVWTPHNDNSLRVHQPDHEAVEYVFSKPLDLNASVNAITALFHHLTSPGVEVFPSYRTSIHVHVSYALETMRTVYNAMTLSIILDELFTSQNGTHRIGNNFCLRARDAEGQIESIIKSTENSGNFYHVNGNHRYSSINFVSLSKFGTIEYRSLECTTDLERLLHWIKTLDRIRQAARKFEDPRDIISYFSRMTPKEFLLHVLGPQALMYLKVDGYDNMLHYGMRLAQDLAYSSKWILKNPEDEKKPVRKSRSRVYDLEAMDVAAAGGPQPLAPAPLAPHHQFFWNAPPPGAQPAPAPQVVNVIHDEVDFDDVHLNWDDE